MEFINYVCITLLCKAWKVSLSYIIETIEYLYLYHCLKVVTFPDPEFSDQKKETRKQLPSSFCLLTLPLPYTISHMEGERYTYSDVGTYAYVRTYVHVVAAEYSARHLYLMWILRE